MKTVEVVMKELHFATVGAVAAFLIKKFPRHRQGKVKLTTRLNSTEVRALAAYKSSYRNFTITRGGVAA